MYKQAHELSVNFMHRYHLINHIFVCWLIDKVGGNLFNNSKISDA